MKIISLLSLVFAIALAVCLGAAPAADKSLRENVIAKEREELDAVKAGNMKAFADLIADDAVFLNSHGPGTKAEVVQHTAAFHLLDYSMEDIKFVPLSEKSGLVAYKLTEKVSGDGKEFTIQTYASAVWAERGGKWVCLFSQETPARAGK